MNKLVDQYDAVSDESETLKPKAQKNGSAAVRALIADGPYDPGDRLPSERELIVGLGLSRSALRKALDVLEFEGVIWRHVGKGTFVARQDGSVKISVIDDIGHQMTPVRMVQARLCVEPALAREAAIHASSSAIDRMKGAIFASRAATTWLEYETQDDLFHRGVAEASDNILLLTLFDQFNAVRRAVAGDAVVRETSRPTETHRSFAEHDRILDAIERRDQHAAHSEMKKHIGSVSGRLFGEF